MQKTDRWMTAVLAVLVVVLLGICVMSIAGQKHASDRQNHSEYAGNNQ